MTLLQTDAAAEASARTRGSFRSVLLAAAATMMLCASPSAFAQVGQDSAEDQDYAAAKQAEELRKLEIENRTAKIAADQAEHDLETARRKAISDALPTSSTTGKVELKAEAGKIEASALTALAINAIAPRIATDAKDAARRSAEQPVEANDRVVCGDLTIGEAAGESAGLAPVLLLSGDERLTFAHWDQFRFRSCNIHGQFVRSIAEAERELGLPVTEPAIAPGEERFFADIAAVATAINVGTKLLQLVTPDWEIGGIAASVSDKALAAAVAREYLARAAGGRIYWAGQVSKLGGSKPVFATLQLLDDLDRKGGDLVDGLKDKGRLHREKLAALAKKKTLTAREKEDKKAAEDEIARLRKFSDPLVEAQGAYLALVKSLNGKEGEATLPINQVVNEAAAATLLGRKGLALNVDVEASGGAYYTRKAIWDVLAVGGAPYWVSGGAVVNFWAVRPADQQVFGAGVVACNAGYVRLNRAAAHANEPADGCPKRIRR